MTIEQTLRGDDRITIKEAVNLIVENLKLSEKTARRKTIYEPDFAQTRANGRYFKRPEFTAAINRRLFLSRLCGGERVGQSWC